MKFSPIRFVFISLLSVMTLSCSEDPGPVGLGVLPPQDSLHVTSVQVSANSDTTYLSRVVGGASTLLVGKYLTMQAATLLSFTGFPAIPPNASLDSVRFSVKINYRFKDSSGTVGFEIRKFLRGFSSTGFTWDTATATGAYGDTVFGSILQNVTPLDSILTTKLDTTLIRQWSQTGGGSLILLPTGNFVTGFSPFYDASTDYRPVINLVYHTGTDTSRPSFRSSSAIFVADAALPAHPGTSVAQAGVAYRSVFKFDSLSLPPRVSVTAAILEIAIDTSASLTNSYTDDNLIAYLSRKNSFPYDSLAFGIKCTAGHDSAQKVYRADVKALVQRWVIREPNYGFVVRASGELATMDRFVLYGASAAPALRPKLTITYTTFP